MSRLCSKCHREMNASDEWRNPFSMCLECDPKGPWDELPDPKPGEIGYVPPDPPEPRKLWRILRQTPLHPTGWVTVIEKWIRRADMEFVLFDLEKRYPEQKFRLEEVQ